MGPWKAMVHFFVLKYKKWRDRRDFGALLLLLFKGICHHWDACSSLTMSRLGQAPSREDMGFGLGRADTIWLEVLEHTEQVWNKWAQSTAEKWLFLCLATLTRLLSLPFFAVPFPPCRVGGCLRILPTGGVPCHSRSMFEPQKSIVIAMKLAEHYKMPLDTILWCINKSRLTNF